MKRATLLIVLACTLGMLHAQTEWVKCIGSINSSFQHGNTLGFVYSRSSGGEYPTVTYRASSYNSGGNIANYSIFSGCSVHQHLEYEDACPLGSGSTLFSWSVDYDFHLSCHSDSGEWLWQIPTTRRVYLAAQPCGNAIVLSIIQDQRHIEQVTPEGSLTLLATEPSNGTLLDESASDSLLAMLLRVYSSGEYTHVLRLRNLNELDDPYVDVQLQNTLNDSLVPIELQVIGNTCVVAGSNGDTVPFIATINAAGNIVDLYEDNSGAFTSFTSITPSTDGELLIGDNNCTLWRFGMDLEEVSHAGLPTSVKTGSKVVETEDGGLLALLSAGYSTTYILFTPQLETSADRMLIGKHPVPSEPIEGNLIALDLCFESEDTLRIAPATSIELSGLFSANCPVIAEGTVSDSIVFKPLTNSSRQRIVLLGEENSATISHCRFEGLTSSVEGVVYGAEMADIRFIDCTWSSNNAIAEADFEWWNPARGAALYLGNTSACLTRCIFQENYGLCPENMSGEVYCDVMYVVNAHVVMDNCLVENVSTSQELVSGSMMMSTGGDVAIVNSVFADYTYTFHYDNEVVFYSRNSDLDLKNSVIMNNGIADVCMYTHADSTSTLRVTYSVLNGGVDSLLFDGPGNCILADTTGVLAGDPMLDATNAEYPYLPLEGSPCIDAGNPSEIWNDIPTVLGGDIAQFPAMGSVRNDIGVYGGPHAFEFTPADPPDPPDPPGTPEYTFMFSNRPNPFNPSTTIAFTLPEDADVTLEMFNVRGQRVATLAREHMSAGNHSLPWLAEGLASGVYFARLQAGSRTTVRKMVLMK